MDNVINEITISIVSMNNMDELIMCVDSIEKNTTGIRYKIIIVAYLFSHENIEKLKMRYSNIQIIEENEIHGFGENHNLVMKNCHSEYLMVLNDDTYFVDNSIKILVETLKENKKAAFVSPLILNTDGSEQINGRPKYTLFKWLLQEMKIINLMKIKNKYTSKLGIYKTYNISGACFLGRTEVIKTLGYFDERYFFIPEDIALSTKANEEGFDCIVNTEATVTHIAASTSIKMASVIEPVQKLGNYIFYGRDSSFRISFVKIISILIAIVKYLLWIIRFKNPKRAIMMKSHLNVIKYSYAKFTPKSLFIKLYNDLMNE